MGGVGSKSRSQGHFFEKSCLQSRGHFLAQSFSNLLRMIVLIMSWSSSIMGRVWSKSRSLGQIFEKFVYTLEVPLLAQSQLAQNYFHDDVLVKFDHGWGRVKK